MGRRVLIATGGTGGHIYPAIALAQQLKADDENIEIKFIGGGLKDNRYFDRETYEFCNVSCGSFISKKPNKLFTSMGNIAKGIWQSQRFIKKFAPDVIVGFGSFYAFPPLVAARLLSVPLVLHEANSIPGKTIRLMSRWATMTGVHFPETIHLLSGNVLEVGMPLRAGFKRGNVTTEEARKYFGLDPNPSLTTVLVFGGSQGSRAINDSVAIALCELKEDFPFQVIHIVGDPLSVKKLSQCYEEKGIRSCVKNFETRMDYAWQAADCVIARAGAGTIAELIEFEVPAIVIPYPHAADDHQSHNANFMSATVGGGIKLLEKEVTMERLKELLTTFLQNPEHILGGMKKAIRDYKNRSRTRDLLSVIKEYGDKE